MRVLKFGGTSVGSVDSILGVKKIVKTIEEPVIVVISALGGIADKLLATSAMASKGDLAYEKELSEIVAYHLDVIEGVIEDKKVHMDIQKKVMALLDELSNIFKGVYLINDLSAKTSDTIVSYGEHLSSLIVSNVIKDARLFNSHKHIRTVKQFNKYVVDFDLTNKLVKRTFSPLPKASSVPGFISSSMEAGEIANLGRGGSDYTTSILTTALDTNTLEVWTDMDGFMTTGPRAINSACVIDRLTFTETVELCNFGAKVIYPPTIYPVYHENIPIRILNTFNPTTPGTYVSKERVEEEGKTVIKDVSSVNDTCLIAVQGLDMVGVIGVNYRIFKTFAKNGIGAFTVSQTNSKNNTTFAVRNADTDLAIQVLNNEFASEHTQGGMNDTVTKKGLATVAIIDENMKCTPDIAGKLFDTLGRAGISVIVCARDASETNISLAIKYKYLRKALDSIHDSFFLSKYKVLNLFIADVGTVGDNLLEQICIQQPKLMRQNGLELNVVGISNSEKALLYWGGINLDNYPEGLKKNGEGSNPKHLCEGIVEMNIFNPMFVDCTASPDVAVLYETLMSNNMSVVVTNKEVVFSSYNNYTKLKETVHHRDIRFLFKTNIGAGLPTINAMSDLINNGDHVLKLEAVLPDTLNYIFDAISADIPFSETVRMAKEAEYAEPGPRIDPNDKDVVHKLVILAHEASYPVERADVKRDLFILEKYFKDSLEDFWKNAKDTDVGFEEKRQLLEAEGRHFRFMAKMKNGTYEVGLQAADNHHPFYELGGSSNVIMISIERYHGYPVIIKRYGAGASVTVAGVFADIMSIANIRQIRNTLSF